MSGVQLLQLQRAAASTINHTNCSTSGANSLLTLSLHQPHTVQPTTGMTQKPTYSTHNDLQQPRTRGYNRSNSQSEHTVLLYIHCVSQTLLGPSHNSVDWSSSRVQPQLTPICSFCLLAGMAISSVIFAFTTETCVYTCVVQGRGETLTGCNR